MSFINYNISLIGDCSNTLSGQFSLSYTGASPPFSIYWVDTITGLPYSSQTLTINPYVVTSLSAGTYSFYLTDSSLQTNSATSQINFVVTSSITATLDVVYNTTCNSGNGVIRGNTPVNYYYNTYQLYKDGEYKYSSSTSSTEIVFPNLYPGVYYAVVTDSSGCQGITDSVIVHNSTDFDFGFYVVNNPACYRSTGRIYVTGLTGTAPYTYKWTENIPATANTATVSGLSEGVYGVTITDAGGCSNTKSVTVSNASYLGLVNYIISQPTCLGADGSITFNISGGSAPYYYLLSNGDIQVLPSPQVTFENLSAGNYDLYVTDAGACKLNYNVSLRTVSTFTLLSTDVQSSFCSHNDGTLTATFAGGTPPYLISLENSTGFKTNLSTTYTTATVKSLSSDTYTLTIMDKYSACTYTSTITVNNQPSFIYDVTTTATTCGYSNGSINVNVTSATTTGLTYTYSLSNGTSSPATFSTGYTFQDLEFGIYDVSISDSSGCRQESTVYVGDSEAFNVVLFPTSCNQGDQGTIFALIEGTDGPFNLTWSDNTNGQIGYYVTGLTAGTYYLTVSGDNGCSQSVRTSVNCKPLSASSTVVTYSTATSNNTLGKILTLQNMLYLGYRDLVKDAQGCSLVSATFNLKVTIDTVDYESPIYRTTTFANVPDMSYFTGVLESAILSIPGIIKCTIDPTTYTLHIISGVKGNVETYKDDTITFIISIDYVINCQSINDISCP